MCISKLRFARIFTITKMLVHSLYRKLIKVKLKLKNYCVSYMFINEVLYKPLYQVKIVVKEEDFLY